MCLRGLRRSRNMEGPRRMGGDFKAVIGGGGRLLLLAIGHEVAEMGQCDTNSANRL